MMVRINAQRIVRFLYIALALSIFAPGLHAATVTAKGMGATQQSAVANALENAVSQHMKTTIVSLTRMTDSKVDQKSFAIDSGIVEQYRVKDIVQTGGSYIATIEAEISEKPAATSAGVIKQWQSELESLDDITSLVSQMSKTREIREQYEQTFLSDFSDLYRAEISNVRLLNEREVELTITLALQTHVLDTYFDMLRMMPPLAADVEAEGWFRPTIRTSRVGPTEAYSQQPDGIFVDALQPKDHAFYLAFEMDGMATGIGMVYRNVLSQSRSGFVANKDGVSETLFDGRGGVLNRTLNVEAYEHYPVFMDPDAHRVRNWNKGKPSVKGISFGGFKDCPDYPSADLYCGNVFEITLRADIYVPRSTLSKLKDDFKALATLHVYPVPLIGPNVSAGSDAKRLVRELGDEPRSMVMRFN